ncbi:hypothetical protein [Pseudomonas sp. RIT411]|uniref:hypothetical protein n=1 Tax=Pseudomonas sp. RIT411 TaxID=2202160 RepID=UPI000D33DDE5|nr:hypothetical protein [Pseudomonas sp. RIT 411]RAU42844.1 hypothetical protein DBY63_001685 [Pseudomonas sp. RIT 411]
MIPIVPPLGVTPPNQLDSAPVRPVVAPVTAPAETAHAPLEDEATLDREARRRRRQREALRQGLGAERAQALEEPEQVGAQVDLRV